MFPFWSQDFDPNLNKQRSSSSRTKGQRIYIGSITRESKPQASLIKCLVSARNEHKLLEKSSGKVFPLAIVRTAEPQISYRETDLKSFREKLAQVSPGKWKEKYFSALPKKPRSEIFLLRIFLVFFARIEEETFRNYRSISPAHAPLLRK